MEASSLPIHVQVENSETKHRYTELNIFSGRIHKKLLTVTNSVDQFWGKIHILYMCIMSTVYICVVFL